MLTRHEQTDETVGISFMTVGELYYGAEKSDHRAKNHRAVERFLLSVEVFNPTTRS
jgi:tRNA(fMet)-specific endonuclease VapC